MRIYRLIPVCAFLFLMIAACAGSSGMNTAQAGLEIEIIRSGVSGQALGPDPGAVWITAAETYESIMGRLERTTLPTDGDIVTVDFERKDVLLLRMGERPTGGYSLALLPKQSYVRGKTAYITVHWVEPDKDALVPQMITHPFLMMTIAKGDFDRISVVDQHGLTHMALPNKQKK